MKHIRKHQKLIAVQFLAFFLSTFYPVDTFAITGHSSMPEYRSFEPVSTTNMVNMFNGGLTYNIPLLEVPNGYPINLSYHSGDVNNEAQASWVGLGWTLNPGAINRVKRGFPDEFDGEKVTYYNRMPKNWTITAQGTVGGEAAGFGVSVGKMISFNNYQGFSESYFGSVSDPLGISSLSMSYSEGKFGFDASVNLAAGMRALSKAAKKDDPKKQKSTESNRYLVFQNKRAGKAVGIWEKNQSRADQRILAKNNKFNWSVSVPKSSPVPLNVSEYDGKGFDIKFDVGANTIPFPLEAGEFGVGGVYAYKNNVPQKDLDVYGYMNSEGALGDENAMMDYFTENEVVYDKQEKNLGIPFPNNDVFSMTGESMGGTFRAFRADFGHYRKNRVESSMTTVESSGDYSAGTNLASVGGEGGGSFQDSHVGAWENDAYNDYQFKGASAFSRSTNERFILRFTGDKATTKEDINETAIRSYAYNQYKDHVNQYEVNSRFTGDSKRSTFVSMRTNEDFQQLSSQYSVPYKVNQKKLKVISSNNVVDDYSRPVDKGIGEVSTFNKNGTRFTYGLPIHTKNERQLTYHIDGISANSFVDGSEGLVINAGNGTNLDKNSDSKIGHYMPSQYVTQMLLTQITSSDYIDRTFDGPTTDDFGSYTSIQYKQAHNSSSWYTYRSPFEGLNYSVGSLSDKRDNMGSFSSGDKELYYINSIASKTHVAVFHTSHRQDGLGVDGSSIGKLVEGGHSDNTARLQKLDKIDLYSIADCELMNTAHDGVYQPKTDAKPIKSVLFEYSYDLCGNLPNNSEDSEQNTRGQEINAKHGKLTLKRVWFEYEGKKTSKISPYEFSYNYPKFNKTGVSSELRTPISPYDESTDAAGLYEYAYNKGYTTQDENPDYVTANSDRWGNYRDYAAMSTATHFGDLARFYPYVDQNPEDQFDPAAWCLKQIKLPSGGSILVQYEQNDYSYVQDKKAMAMVPLLNDGDAATNDQAKYYLDLDKLGINESDVDDNMVEQLFAPLIQENKRLFFSFLYRLEGGGNPNYNSTNSEFIDGYAYVRKYGKEVVNGKMRVFFSFSKNSNGKPLYMAGEDDELPRNVCREMYASSRKGLVSDGQGNGLDDDKDKDSKADVLKYLVQRGARRFNQCKQMEPSMSFVRVQLPETKAKLGGGVRVKRLLMYDEGIGSNGKATVYGNEYDYTTKIKSLYTGQEETISSGVATSEPSVGRRESPLVNPLERDRETKFFGLVAGKKLYKNEGPLGESFYPSASVGYSKVTVSNIHKGYTSTGKVVHEFHTCKDFPVKVKTGGIRPVSGTNFNTGGLSGGSLGGSMKISEKMLYQGYTFINNNMHGQPKRVQQYSNGADSPQAETVYDYFDYDEKVPVMDESLSTNDEYMGVDMEVFAESREVQDVTKGGSFGMDVSFGYTPTPIPVPVFYTTRVKAGGHYKKTIVKTHVTNKLITYPAILKKVTNISPDRISHVTENLAFDRYTGDAVQTRSYDDFDQPFISQQIMASWEYPAMRAKAINERVRTSGKFMVDNGDYYLNFNYPTMDDCEALAKFTEGDFIEVFPSGGTSGGDLFHVAAVDLENLRVELLQSGLELSVGLMDEQFIDIEVIQSGYKNNMAASVGGYTYKEDNLDYSKQNEDQFSDEIEFIQQLNAGLNSYFTDGVRDGNFLIFPEGQNPNFEDDLNLSIGHGVTSSTCNEKIKEVAFKVDFNDDYSLMTIDPSAIKTETGVIDCPPPVNTIERGWVSNTGLAKCGSIYASQEKIYGGGAHDGSRRGFDIDLWRGHSKGRDAGQNWRFTSFPNGKYLHMHLGETLDWRVDFEAYSNHEFRDPKIKYSNMGIRSLSNPFNFEYLSLIKDPSSSELLHSYTFNKVGGFILSGETKVDWPGGRDFDPEEYRVPICVDAFSPDFRVEKQGNTNFSYTGDPLKLNFRAIDNLYPYEKHPDFSTYQFEWKLFKKIADEYRYFSSDLSAVVSNRYGSEYRPTIYSPGEYLIQINVTEESPYTVPQIMNYTFTIRDDSETCKCGNGINTTGIVSSFHPEDGEKFTDKVGQFYYSKITGKVFYKAADCPLYRPMNCMKVCSPPGVSNQMITIPNAVTASASTLSDQWGVGGLPGSGTKNVLSSEFNSYERGSKGNWRILSSYTYRADLQEKNDATLTKNFEKGLFELELFNWQSPTDNGDSWVKTSTVTSYDFNGQADEDENILGVKSAAIYGYNATLPIMVAQNASHPLFGFNGFEQVKDGKVEIRAINGGTGYATVNSDKVHTGSYSAMLGSQLRCGYLAGTTSSNRFVVRFWANSSNRQNIADKLTVQHYKDSHSQANFDVTKVSSSGEWTLYEAVLQFNQNYSLAGELRILYSGSSTVYVDDFRFQPFESEAVCYVYDHAQRLTAVFDDQHFASLYQYNAEGALVRKLKETTEGVKTISETQYNTKGVKRDNNFGVSTPTN